MESEYGKYFLSNFRGARHKGFYPALLITTATAKSSEKGVIIAALVSETPLPVAPSTALPTPAAPISKVARTALPTPAAPISKVARLEISSKARPDAHPSGTGPDTSQAKAADVPARLPALIGTGQKSESSNGVTTKEPKSGPSSGSPPGSPFVLAPPPAPSPSVSISQLSPAEKVTIIDRLTEQKAKDDKNRFSLSESRKNHDEDVLNVMGTFQVNDEECLLGGQLNDQLNVQVPVGSLHDGVDSPSASEDDVPTAQLVREEPGVIPVPPSVGATLIPMPASIQSAPSAYQDVDIQVTKQLDQFFKDDNMWMRIVQEVDMNGVGMLAARADIMAGGADRRTFRVQVPKPYPGVQYRKTKSIDDRAARYAKHGAIVTGSIEDGEWLRISPDTFLPLRVGAVWILDPVTRNSTEDASKERSC